MTKKFIKIFGKICKFGSKALMFSNEGVSPIPPEIELPKNLLNQTFEYITESNYKYRYTFKEDVIVQEFINSNGILEDIFNTPITSFNFTYNDDYTSLSIDSNYGYFYNISNDTVIQKGIYGEDRILVRFESPVSVKGKWIGTTPKTDLNLPQMKVVIDINDENVTIYRNTGFGIDDGTKFAYKYGIGNMFSGSNILKSDDDEYITIFSGYPLTYNTTYAENFYQYKYNTSTATYTLEGNRLKVIISGTMYNTGNDDIVETVMYFDKVNDDSIQLFEELSDIIPKFEITKFIGIDTNFDITRYYPVFFLETNLSDYIVELSTNLFGSHNVNKPASVMCHNMLYWTYKLDDGEWNSIVRTTNYDTNIPYKSQKNAIMINGTDSKALVNVFDGNEHTITIGLRYGPTNSVLPITASVSFNKATSSIINGDIPDDVGKPVVNGNVVY